MTDKDRIKLEARLGAIEFAICDIAAIGYMMGGWTAKQINERYEHWNDLVRSAPIEGMPPAEAV
jgi:hypothetical protein